VWLDDAADLRHTSPRPRKNPGSPLIVIFTLALGIGANTTIFTLLDAWSCKTFCGNPPRTSWWSYESPDADTRIADTRHYSYPTFETHQLVRAGTGKGLKTTRRAA